MVTAKAAPVRLAPGDEVQIKSGAKLTVEKVRVEDGKPVYIQFNSPGARLSCPWAFMLTRLARRDWKVVT